MGVGAGFGKLLLFGEHSAVYGKNAVGVALPYRTTVRVSRTDSEGIVLRGLSTEDLIQVEKLLAFVSELKLPITLPDDCAIDIESNVPRASGLGSSAAFSVAFANAMGSADRGDAESNMLWRCANEIERYFHGTPSGIDTGLALYGGVQALYPDPPHIPKAKRLRGARLSMIVGTARRESTTKRLVASIREKMTNGDLSARASVDRLGRIADRAIGFLDSESAAASEIADLCGEAQTELGRLGVTTELLDRILNSGIEFGAMGGKLSGAGGGGAFFLIVRDPESALETAFRLARWAVDRNLPVRLHGVFNLTPDGALSAF